MTTDAGKEWLKEATSIIPKFNTPQSWQFWLDKVYQKAMKAMQYSPNANTTQELQTCTVAALNFASHNTKKVVQAPTDFMHREPPPWVGEPMRRFRFFLDKNPRSPLEGVVQLEEIVSVIDPKQYRESIQNTAWSFLFQRPAKGPAPTTDEILQLLKHIGSIKWYKEKTKSNNDWIPNVFRHLFVVFDVPTADFYVLSKVLYDFHSVLLCAKGKVSALEACLCWSHLGHRAMV